MRLYELPRFALIATTLLLTGIFFAIPAHAESIEEINRSLATGKAEQAELEKKARSIEGDLEKTRGHLVETAGAVQKSEKTLQELDQKIATLEKDDKQIREKLENGRAETAHLLLALERLRRVPPEAMIARPEAPLKTAQSALLMREILPVLNARAQALKEDLKNLETVSATLKAERERALQESEKLKKEQTALDALAAQRKALYAEAHKDLKAQEEKVQRISIQAKSVADLVKRLEEDRRKQAVREEAQHRLVQKPLGKHPGKIEKMPGAGNPNLPVSGTIITHFEEPDDFGAPSQGIRIKGRAGALVTAPMGGIVRFAGSFKSYGNMIIIEHEKGWHSLVAGLEKIDTVVGQSLSAGEPLGALRRSKSPGSDPVLYYELRYNGKAVNPSKKLAGLS